MNPETVIVLPPNEGFGVEAVGAIGLLAHRLARAGADGIVLGGATGGPPFPDVRFRAVRPGWGVSRTARYVRGVAASVRALRPALIEVHNRPEVALGLAGRGRPVSLILNNDPQGMRGAAMPAQRRRLLERLALVMTSSDWLRRRLLEGVEAPGRVPVVLHNCIDLPPAPRAARERLILFAGRIVQDKGADSFVEACGLALARLPGWRAEMIGADRFRADAPDTPFIEALRPQAAAAGVAMRGHQPNAAILEAMGRAAIVVVPSRWAEPFGLVALEAMACGAALVCSARGGLPEVAGEAALYADPDDPADLARAILALAMDRARRDGLAEAARSRAAGFTAPQAAARLLALRREIVAP